MVDGKQTPKSKAKKDDMPIKPKLEKPDGYKEVQFKYVGDSVAYSGKTLISYVSEKVAKLYRDKMRNLKAKGFTCNILKVEE
jgi:hypothetical protein